MNATSPGSVGRSQSTHEKVSWHLSCLDVCVRRICNQHAIVGGHQPITGTRSILLTRNFSDASHE